MQSVTASFKGLYAQPNDLGDVPDGALSQADDVVISRDGILEPRRGTERVATEWVYRLAAFKKQLIGHYGSTLKHSADGVTWSDYAGTLSAPDFSKVRFAEAEADLFITAADGVQRLDAVDGTPVPAGVPAGLDVDAQVGANGTAVPNNTQVAYRVVFGKKDANGRLLLGAPSGRTVLTNTSGSTKDASVVFSLPRGLDPSSFFQVYRSRASVNQTTDPGDELGLVLEGAVPQPATVTGLSRASNVVTATTAAAHGYTTGSIVRMTQSVGVPGGTLVAVGSSGAAAKSTDGSSWTSVTVPAGTYRAVVKASSAWVAVGTNVAATSPDGITWTARTIPSGTYYAVAKNDSGFVAVGASVAATSPDGVTWTSRTIPSGTYYGVAWNGSVYAAVGPSYSAATSPDGITWTHRAIPADYGDAYAIAWNGVLFSAVGHGQFFTSPDGTTWTARTPPNSASYYSVVSNGSLLVAVGSGAAATSPDGVAWTVRSIPTGTYTGAAWNGSLFVAVANGAGATSADGITWSPVAMPAGAYLAVFNAPAAVFSSGEKTITGTPSGTTFTYAENGVDGSASTSQTATPLTGAATDTVPDGFLGAYLYTNENSGDGILASNDRPPLSRDLQAFRGTLFALNTTAPASGTAYLLGVSGANGLQSGDTVTINGLVYTAGASESISGRTFKLETSGTPSFNIAKTTASLIRIVNRSLSSGVTLLDTSDPNGVPGAITFRCSDPVSALTVTFSRTTAWSPSAGISAQPVRFKNGVAYSKPNEPDHFSIAITNSPIRVGSADKEALRGVPTRDSLLLWKEDGLYRVSPGTPWDVAPLDPTISLVAPDTAVALNGAVYALTEQGVVRANEGGVEIVSRPIETLLFQALSPAMRPTTRSVAYAVAYESDRKYLLALPSSPDDAEATQFYVLDIVTNAWTHWTVGGAHAIVNPADDRLYIATNGTVRRERKTLDATDYEDDAGQGIVPAVKLAPKFGGNPGALNLFSEVAWIFRTAQFTSASASFSSSIDPATESVPLSGANYACDAEPAPQLSIRVPVPQNKARASQLNVGWTSTQLRAPWQLQGVSVLYRPCSTRLNR